MYLFEASICLFLIFNAATLGSSIRIYWKSSSYGGYTAVRQSEEDDSGDEVDTEEELEEKLPPAKRNLLDYSVLILSLVNSCISNPLIIWLPVQTSPFYNKQFFFLLSLGWFLHFIHLLLFDCQKGSFRHFWAIYLVCFMARIQSADRIFVLTPWDMCLNLLPIMLSGLMFILDIYKPALNAKLLDSRKNVKSDRFPSPEVTASTADIISFGWIKPLMQKGYEKPLEEEDLPDLRSEDRMANIIRLWKSWRRERISRKNSVIYDLIMFSLRSLVLALVTAFLFVSLEFANPFFINLLLQLLQKPRDDFTIENGIYLLLGLLTSNIVKQIAKSQNILLCRKWGYQVRAILIHEIFFKSLKRVAKLTPSQDAKTIDGEARPASSGKIISLMSSDVQSIRNYFLNIDMLLIDVPVSAFFSISGLLYLMGPSALSGLGVILLSAPCTSWALTRLYKSQREVRTRKDRRIQVTNETFLGIRIIKYYAWEESFLKKMIEARVAEIKSIWDRIYDNVLVSIIGSGSSILITFLSFFFYTVVAGHKLDAATAFSSITLMGEMNSTLNGLGSKVAKFLDVRINVERIYNFLQEEEVQDLNDNRPSVFEPDTDTLASFKIALSEASFEYHGSQTVAEEAPPPSGGQEEQTPLLHSPHPSPLNGAGGASFTLRDVSVDFPLGKLSICIGKTGAGKTSLLLAMLGEMKKLSGRRHMPLERKQVAFCPQSPWLTNNTIRDNILFGKQYDAEKYYQVVRACQLLKDFETLEYGDLTEIGEKGVNLSGGQKARISLARAAYSDASLILLDDPLSAVDAPTARALLYQCLLSLMKEKTIILVTNAVGLVFPKADFVVFMENGSISIAGTPEEASKLISAAGFNIKDDLLSPTENADTFKDAGISGTPLKSVSQSQYSEGKAVGKVKRKTYNSYIVAAGGLVFGFALLGTFLLTTLSQYLNRWWITVWTDSAEEVNPLFFIVVFGLIGLMDIATNLARLFLTYIAGLRAAQKIHDGLAESVLGSPMRWFELTPVGRIINRFDKDMGSIDSEVMSAFVAFAAVLVGAVLRIIIVAFVTPSFLIMLFLLVFYYRLAIFYLASSRELKRINSVSISPIYGLFGEILQGVGSIRAYDCQRLFEDQMRNRVDGNHRADFYLFGTNRYLQFRTAILSSLVVFVAGGSVLFSNLSAGWAGLTLSIASSITSMLSGLVWSQSALELSMNAVERIDEYSRLPQEKLLGQVPASDLPPHWPNSGIVEVEDLMVRYADDLPYVLKGLSFSIADREKVAIVGRTGAGKSTMSLCFWRILEFEGIIKIDGVDISTLGVRDLRKGLTIIPQEPVLFEGSLRSNIDPNGEHDDPEIWAALRETAFPESLQDQQEPSLDVSVSLNGNNFSQGQKQLICLARALLRSSRFIFLDEATASVDHQTDALIQKAIRSCFSKSTIVTVAHRLKTVIDYDKVLVLQEGRILEWGSPTDLVARKGEFYSMLQETGEMNELLAMIGLSKV